MVLELIKTDAPVLFASFCFDMSELAYCVEAYNALQYSPILRSSSQSIYFPRLVAG